MPGATGGELARKLRAMRPALPILLMSGRVDLEGLDLEHFDEVHFKNSSLSTVFSAIASLLKDRRG